MVRLANSRRDSFDFVGLARSFDYFQQSSTRSSSLSAFDPVDYSVLSLGCFQIGSQGSNTGDLRAVGVRRMGNDSWLWTFHFFDSFPVLLTLQLFIVSNAITFLALVSVIEERRVAQTTRRENEKRLAGNLAITQILAESPELSEATRRILSSVGETLNWEAAAFWIHDKETGTLRLSEIWHSAKVKIDHFETASRQQTFVPGVGLPGRVWQQRVPVWIADVADDDNFPRAPAALADGLRSAFGFPIVSDDELLGIGSSLVMRSENPTTLYLRCFGALAHRSANLLAPTGGGIVTRKGV